MRSRNVAWGLVLVAIGALMLLGNLGYGGVYWDVLWRLWPAILIYTGLVRVLEYFGV